MSVDLFSPDLGFDIPAAAVAKLQNEMSSAREQAKRFTDIVEDRERKLAAIRQLAPHLFTEKRVINLEDTSLESAGSKSLVDAVVTAVNNAGRPLSPKEIRAAVIAQGDGDLIGSENYLYTAIKRAVDGDRIGKQDDGYVPFALT